MTKYKPLDPAKYRHMGPEMEAYIRKHNALREELNLLTSTPEFKADEAEFQTVIKGNPMIGRVLWMKLYSQLPSAKKRNVEAVSVLIDRFEQILLEEPALQASREVSDVLRAVISSLETVNPLNSDYIGIMDAIAQPSKSLTNKVNASVPRAKEKDGTKKKDLAEEHFNEWAANPSLYHNKAAFKRELYERSYCLDQGHAGTWLNEFLALLLARDPEHPLVRKLVKK